MLQLPSLPACFWSKQETYFVFCVPPHTPAGPDWSCPGLLCWRDVSGQRDTELSGPTASLLLITPLQTGELLFLHGRLTPFLLHDVTTDDLCRVLTNNMII